MTREEMAARLAEMSELAMWEWRLHAFDGDRLTLIGGQDMDYAHFAEAYFGAVSYISCPLQLKHPHFRLATDHEFMRAALEAEVGRGAYVIAIDSATTSSPSTTSLLVATSVDVEVKTVLYHARPTH